MTAEQVDTEKMLDVWNALDERGKNKALELMAAAAGEPDDATAWARLMAYREEMLSLYNELDHGDEATDERASRLTDGADSALSLLLTQPAPDLNAMLWKLDAIDREMEIDGWDERWRGGIRTLKADLLQVLRDQMPA